MKTNRIIALLLSVIFIFSVNVTSFAANEEDALFEPAFYSEILSLLNTLGVVDANLYAEGSPDVVKRGEFAQAAAKVIGVAPTDTFEAIFTDVPAEHQYAPYIYAMKKAGYMNGVSENAFAPDEPVYFEQAVSVLVKLAGYNDVAMATGGYPAGYISIASKIGIFENVNPVSGAPLSKGVLLELIKSTITCDMLVPTSYGSSTSYASKEGVNILSYYHKIYEGTGIVNADAVSTMDSERAQVGHVIIEGVDYKLANDTILDGLVGRKVTFYYKTQSNTKTIIFGMVDSDVRVASFIAGPDLGFSYSTGTYTYETPDKTLKYKIGYNYRVVYNMNELYPVLEDKMLPDAGTLTLIDNDDDGTYEVIIVEEFINVIADNYNETLDMIPDLYDSSRSIKFADYESYQLIDAVGAPFAKLNVLKDDIIEFYESADGKSFTALVNRSGLPATVDSIDENYVYTGSTKYLISADVRESASSLFLGASYTLYLNTKGELVYWKRGDDLKFGYVLDANGNAGLVSEAWAKIYAPDGTIATYPIADKVVNYTTSGTSATSATVLKTDYATLFPEVNHREVIAYKLNAEGQIAIVYHPMIITDRATARNLPAYPLYRLDFYYGETQSASPALIVSQSIRNIVAATKKAPVLVVPSVSTPVNDNCLKVIGSLRDALYSDFNVVPDITVPYTGENEQISFYMIGNTYPLVSMLVYHAEVSANSATASTGDFTITNIKQIYDKEEMEEKIVIEGRAGSATKLSSIEITDPALLKSDSFLNTKFNNKAIKEEVLEIIANKKEIVIGDVIQPITDTSGAVIGITLVYDSVTHTSVYGKTGQHEGLAGTVTYVGNGAIEYETAGTTFTLDVSALPTWVFEADREENRAGSYLDFEVGDRIYHFRFATGNRSLVIYK